MDVRTCGGFWRWRHRRPAQGFESLKLRRDGHLCYQGRTIVKVPDPVQPVLPVRVHVPEIVLPFADPDRTSAFPEGVPDWTFNPNFPVIFPLKFPLSVKDPLSVSFDAKQGEFVVKLKLEMVNDPSPFTIKEAPKVKTVVLLVSSSVAFHVPLTLAGFELLFAPHPTNVRPTISNTTVAKYFIGYSLGLKVQSARFRCPMQWSGGSVPLGIAWSCKPAPDGFVPCCLCHCIRSICGCQRNVRRLKGQREVRRDCFANPKTMRAIDIPRKNPVAKCQTFP